MPEIQQSHGTLAYDDRGQGGPALLLLPGWCSDRSAFASLPEHLAQRHRTLTVDWPGHGKSSLPAADFGTADLVESALAVIEAVGVEQVVPVALSHAGWVALELRRRLGARVPKLVLLDWIILDPPPPFLGALQALQEAEAWQSVRQQLFGMWAGGHEDPALLGFLNDEMGSYGFEMWARAGREISRAYAEAGNPIKALLALEEPVPTLHLYSQPADPAYLGAQQALAASHPWFHVTRLDARSHFPMFEVPTAMADAIEKFVAARPVAAT